MYTETHKYICEHFHCANKEKSTLAHKANSTKEGCDLEAIRFDLGIYTIGNI